jgi:hypothetical protein
MHKSSFLKRSAWVLTLVLAGIALPSPADNTPGAPADPVLLDNDFSADPFLPSDNKWWTSDPTQVTWVQDTIHNGKGAIKLTSPDKKKSVATYGPYLSYTGPSIKVSVEVKTDSVTTGAIYSTTHAAVVVYYFDADRKEIDAPWKRYHDLLEIPDGTQDWQTYDRTFTLPAAAANVGAVRICVILPGSGTVWVDKLTVTQVP